ATATATIAAATEPITNATVTTAATESSSSNSVPVIAETEIKTEVEAEAETETETETVALSNEASEDKVDDSNANESLPSMNETDDTKENGSSKIQLTIAIESTAAAEEKASASDAPPSTIKDEMSASKEARKAKFTQMIAKKSGKTPVGGAVKGKAGVKTAVPAVKGKVDPTKKPAAGAARPAKPRVFFFFFYDIYIYKYMCILEIQ
ncbi:hypothetical protein RFI_13064, partial [Reticulomyxa filosa]